MNDDIAAIRAEHVGSLLRPAALRRARQSVEAGEMPVAHMIALEDAEIERALRIQEEIGMGSVTDGEYRRRWWQYDYFRGLNGVSAVDSDGGSGRAWSSVTGAAVVGGGDRIALTGRIAFDDHPMLRHFAFIRERARAVPRTSIPSPSVLHSSLARSGVSADHYPDPHELAHDIARAYRDAISAFHRAGCNYLQLDDTTLAAFCSGISTLPSGHSLDDYVTLLSGSLRDRPRDMTIAMHICRGNYRSAWRWSGGYEAIADAVFNRLPIDRYFLEYDSERAGGFDPLRFLPAGKQVVLGLVTSKSGALEHVDALASRIREAERFTPLERLALSPQCGFASTEEGNLLSDEEQWAKLRLVVETARDVWGG